MIREKILIRVNCSLANNIKIISPIHEVITVFAHKKLYIHPEALYFIPVINFNVQ
jgi:hypothetical protein